MATLIHTDIKNPREARTALLTFLLPHTISEVSEKQVPIYRQKEGTWQALRLPVASHLNATLNVTLNMTRVSSIGISSTRQGVSSQEDLSRGAVPRNRPPSRGPMSWDVLRIVCVPGPEASCKVTRILSAAWRWNPQLLLYSMHLQRRQTRPSTSRGCCPGQRVARPEKPLAGKQHDSQGADEEIKGLGTSTQHNLIQ